MKKLVITEAQIMKMQRAANRLAQIELGIPYFKHKTHKSKKDFNRKESKKINLD